MATAAASSWRASFQGCRSVEEFQCLNRIEEGTYGVVYRAKDKKTGGCSTEWSPKVGRADVGQEPGGTENLSSGRKEFLLRSIVLGCTHRPSSGPARRLLCTALLGPRAGSGREGGRASCSSHSQRAGTEIQAWAILTLGTVNIKVIEHTVPALRVFPPQMPGHGLALPGKHGPLSS